MPPGIYSIAAAGSVGGHLILDAIEDTNAVFIFRFGGAFTIGAAAIITLINGAKACNVYWVSEGALAIDAAAFVKGNFICNAGAISFGTSSELEGRLLSISGAIDFGPTHLNLPLFCTSYYIGSNYVFNKCIVCTTPDFIMYSGGGAITNTGNAIFNGNVGSDAGMISGFGTSTITGAFYNADGITARTKIDLQNADYSNKVDETYNEALFALTKQLKKEILKDVEVENQNVTKNFEKKIEDLEKENRALDALNIELRSQEASFKKEIERFSNKTEGDKKDSLLQKSKRLFEEENESIFNVLKEV